MGGGLKELGENPRVRLAAIAAVSLFAAVVIVWLVLRFTRTPDSSATRAPEPQQAPQKLAPSSSASAAPEGSALALASASSSAHASVDLDALPGVDPHVVALHEALYQDNQLVACIEETMRFDDEEQGRKVRMKLEGADPKAIASATTPDLTLLPEPCEKTFADRRLLASCEFVRPANEKLPPTQTFARYYSFSHVFDDDTAMRACVANKGKWWALDRTSKEYDEAKADGWIHRATGHH